MNKFPVGSGSVYLLAGGGRVYADVAARFVRSEKSASQILASEYDANIVRRLVDSNHGAALEFDYFIFGIEGFARVTEVQLVRKRLASYLIKSGRPNKSGKRSYDVVIPDSINRVSTVCSLDPSKLILDSKPASAYGISSAEYLFTTDDILRILESWYNAGVILDVPEEDLRYLKPQATEFKALIGMNAHALRVWFMIRCCKNAQSEIRDLACKMLSICKSAAPDLFYDAGPSCVRLGYCPENSMQNPSCKVIRKDEAMALLRSYRRDNP